MLGGVVIAWPLSVTANAQPAARRYRLGILRPTAPFPTNLSSADLSSGIPLALRELGYVEGKNLVLEQRFADGNVERLPELARELAALKPDAIVAVGSAAIRAAKDASGTIPIVLFGNFDPVALGIVASLARPEGNITGVLIAPEGTLAGKKLELLKEAVPRATRIALLSHGDPGVQLQVREAQKAASALGLELVVVNVVGSDYRSAFAAIAALKPDAATKAGQVESIDDEWGRERTMRQPLGSATLAVGCRTSCSNLDQGWRKKALLLSWLEQRNHNPLVRGSSPWLATKTTACVTAGRFLVARGSAGVARTAIWRGSRIARAAVISRNLRAQRFAGSQ